MDDFNSGNNFEDYNRDDDDSSIIDDISDIKDNAKDLKKEYKNYKSSKDSLNSNSSINDNGRAFRENLRSSSKSYSGNPATQGIVNNSTTSSAGVSSGGTATGGTVAGGAAAGGTTSGGAAAGGTAAGGTAAGGTAAGGTAAGGTAAGGTAAGGTAAGGAAAGGTAAGGTAAGGAAAGGAAAGGAAGGAAAGAAAAGVSATGVGAIVVAAAALLVAIKKLINKVDKKIEENTGIDTKKMRRLLLLGVFCFLFLFIFVGSSLFVVSDTAYDELAQLIKRREERYGKPLIMFTDSEYDEVISKDYDKDNCYKTILNSYGDDMLDTFLTAVDKKNIEEVYSNEELDQKQKEATLLDLGADEVKKYLKCQRKNFNKIIWNASRGYNNYSFKASQRYTSYNSYRNDKSGNATLTNNTAAISSGAVFSDQNIYFWDIYKQYNQGLEMHEIKDDNGKGTGLLIPSIVLDGEENKDEAAKYYVELLGDYLQKWVIPYTMLIDSQDKDFINKVIEQMYHRVDVNVYKLSKEVKNTQKSYYMKANSYDHVLEYVVYNDDASGHHIVDGNTVRRTNEKTDLNTRDNPIGTSVKTERIGEVNENGRRGVRYRETTTYVELDPSNSAATEGDGTPMVKEINVTRAFSKYKNVPKVVNIESFYEIIREQYKINAINESNPANSVSSTTKDVDSENGILTERYSETWYEELEKVGQTEKKGYSVSYYTDEQLKNLGRKISRVEWAQDYGDPNASTSSGSSGIINVAGEKGGESGTLTRHGKKYKIYRQGNFKGNIPGAGCGLTSTCMILSAYRPDLDLNPNGLADQLGWTEPRSIAATAEDFKRYGVDVELHNWSNYSDGMPGKKTQGYNEIKANLQAGRPVFILVAAPCPYTRQAHYMVLVDIDSNSNVTILDSSDGTYKTDTLSNMIEYIFENEPYENGYILIKGEPDAQYTGNSNSTNSSNNNSGSNNSSSTSGDNSVSEENSRKLTEMLNYGMSLQGKVLYVWGGGPYTSKEALVSNGADCSGFVISLYKIFFSKNFNPNRVAIYDSCESVNVDGLKGQKVFDGGNGTAWNSEIESKIKPGDLVYTSGHISMYAGDIKGDGTLYVISQGHDMGPQIEDARSYYTYCPILGICRFVGDATITGSSSSNAKVDNSRIFPTKTSKELKYAYANFGDGKGYSYDDLYFAYYHIEQYYAELEEVNGNSSDSEDGGDFGWPIDIKKYPGCEVINCFYGYTPAYGKSHSGADISSGNHVTGSTLHVGPEIIAAHDGKVIRADSDPSSDASAYTCVQIQTEDKKIITEYGHLSKILVKAGDEVKKGDVIGRMGNTGESTGTHLHFGMYENGTRTDPLNYYILAKVGSDEAVDYSKIDKNSITSLPTGYKFLREKGGGSKKLLDFIVGWESKGTLSSDGKKYKIVSGPEGNRTVGPGLDLDAGNYDTVLEKAGYPTALGSYVDKDFVDSLFVKDVKSKYRDPVVSRVSGLNLEEYQIDALASRTYNCGIEGALGMRNGKTFVEAYKAYWKKSDKSKKVNYNHSLYTNYMNVPITSDGVVYPGLITRREKEWKLFQTGVYDSSH